MQRARSPGDADRSVYSMLFPPTPGKGKSSFRLANNDTTVNDYTVNLTALDAAITKNNNMAKSSAVSQEAHKLFCEALYSLGRSESYLIDPIPLVERYSKLSEEIEEQLTERRSNDVKELSDFFHKEKYTWTLVWALLAASQGNDVDMNYHMRLPTSDAEEIDDLFDSSCDFRMAQTLVDWLERRYAEERSTSNSATLHAFKEGGGMYEATTHVISTGRTPTDMISELDPDAPLRQNKKIHEQDLEDEQRLYRCVFELVRAGKVTEAQKLAMHQGHFMLAAGMQGWKAFKANIRDENGALLPDEGNPYRDVWKVVVWAKLRDDRVSPAEKAIYAVLCGNLEMLLPLCPRWEDQLWAHLKTLVDVATELHLRNVRGADLGPLPDQYPKENDTLDQILKRLEAQRELEANEFFRQLYKFLMLQDSEGLLNYMYEACREMSDIVNCGSQISHQLRLMANLALFLKYNRQHDGNLDKVDYIVAFYVQRLVDEGLHEVIPKCVLHLPDQLREACYLRLLRSLRNLSHSERLAIIEAAQNESIDVYKYLRKFVYETIHANVNEKRQTDEVTPEDLEKIDALKWLFAQPGHSLLGLKNVNTALRSAILSERTQAARRIISLVPQESIREMAAMAVQLDSNDIDGLATPNRESVQNFNNESDDMETDAFGKGDGNEGNAMEYKKALKEYLCFQEYLEAHLTFNEWFQHYHRERPQDSILAGDGSSARNALTMEFAKKSLATKREAWKATLNGLCDRSTQHLHCILNYPDGGFMRDPIDEVDDEVETSDVLDEDRRRTGELKALRRICIPQITLLLHSVLHGTGRYSEAMEIANLIAGETLCLYKEFSTDDLGTLLTKIQESSVELLKIPGNVDPYGMGEL